MLEALQSTDFEGFLHQPFEITIVPTVGQPGLVRQLTLIEVARGRYAPPRASQRQPFSLIFRDAAGGVLPQAIYQLSHASLGTIELFLVPIAAHQHGTDYQAIFN
jgi:hypothetical protein